MTDARHVRNAVARFDQVTDVSESDRALAFANIKKAAKHYGVELGEDAWQELGVHPQRKRTGTVRKAAKKTAPSRKKSARK
jgi:hypothetical protein